MSSKSLKYGLILAVAVTMAGIEPAAAEEQAGAAQRTTRTQPKTDAEGYRTATRLGGARSLYAACRAGYNPRCVGTRAAVQRMAKNRRFQKDLASVMDQAGLTKHTAEVLRILQEADASVLRETEFPIGETMEWMGLWNRNRTDIIQKLRWGGGRPPRPFGAWEFTIKDGYRNYNFVLPKPCANLTLRNVTEEPLPECVTLDTQRSCDTPTKTMTIAASGPSISGKQIARVEVSRAGTKLTDLMPEGNWRFTGPIQPGSYTARGFDQYNREVQICGGRSSFTIEDCPAPPPPPPPTATTCELTATAAPARGGWAITVDGSASGQGASPAREMTVEVIGPAGTAVPFEYQGQSQSSATLASPFQATLLVRRPAAGSYIVRAKTAAEDRQAAGGTCEATVAITPEERVSFFVGGYGGKERRQREVELENGVVVTPGFCAPLIGAKGGVGFRVAPNFQIAPAIGVAFNLDEGDQSSVFADLEFNYLFDQGGYLGTGIGWWDFNHGDSDTGSWLLHFGVPVYTTANGNKLFLAGEWRFLLDGFDEADSNYQFWGGLRYQWGRQ